LNNRYHVFHAPAVQRADCQSPPVYSDDFFFFRQNISISKYRNQRSMLGPPPMLSNLLPPGAAMRGILTPNQLRGKKPYKKKKKKIAKSTQVIAQRGKLEKSVILPFDSLTTCYFHKIE